MKAKKNLFLLFFACLLLNVAQAQETASGGKYQFTLEQCLQYAFGNNYTRKSMELSEQTKETVYQQSKMEHLPDLSISLSESFSNSKSNSSSWNGNYGINASIPIYQGGSIMNTTEQNKLSMEQAGYQTAQYDNELTIQILQTFLTVLGNEELLKFQDAVVKASEEQLKQGKEQYQVGKTLESDYLLLEAQYASDMNNIVETKTNRDNSLLTLKSLLSMDPTGDLQIIYPDTASISQMSMLPSREAALEKSLKTLPNLKISEYGLEIAKMGVKISKSGYLPSIGLSGSVGTGHINDYNNFGTQLSDRLNEQVGISINIPLYDKGRTKAKVAQSKIALQQAEFDKMQTELNIRQNVIQEYQNVVSAYSKYQATDVRQNAYLKTFEAYRAQFNVGAITAVDLLQQQNNYISALNDFIQSKYGFVLKRKILDVYMGEFVKL